MALISSFEQRSMVRNSVHDGIGATYSTFERDGRRFIQVELYGRAEQKFPAKRARAFSWTRNPRARYSRSFATLFTFAELAA